MGLASRTDTDFSLNNACDEGPSILLRWVSAFTGSESVAGIWPPGFGSRICPPPPLPVGECFSEFRIRCLDFGARLVHPFWGSLGQVLQNMGKCRNAMAQSFATTPDCGGQVLQRTAADKY